MTSNWQRPISRRQVLSRAVAGAAAGAALLTPMRWAAGPGLVSASVRPVAATEFGAQVPAAWFDLTEQLIRRTPGFSPPVASRAIGCLGVGLYEAIVPGIPDHISLAGAVHGLPSMPSAGRSAAYHWPSVANAAMAAMTRNLFPTAPADLRREIRALEASLERGAPPGMASRSIQRGREIASAIDAWSRGDGGHEGFLRNFPADYVPPEGPGLWVPTLPGFLPALQPTWGGNRCMVLRSPGDCDPGPPPEFSTEPRSAFFGEALEVHEAVNRLTPEQREITLFWSDDPGLTATPPGHSVSILTQLLRAQDRSLAFAAEAYARVGAAVCDAFIACWHVKYRENLVRPITYIRRHIDPAWGDPLPLDTPPFPEYTSGHSVQSAAAAEVMTSLFGSVAFTDHTHDARGMAPRSFSSPAEFAQEAAISRLYGGIHYRSAIERGLDHGRCIGAAVNAVQLRRA